MHQLMPRKQLLLIISLILTLVAAATGFWMWQRYQQQKLWGYSPLALLLCAWAAIVLFRAWRKEKKAPDEQHWKRLVLSTLSGILLGLGFPGWLPFPLVLFVAFVPLLVLERDLNENGGTRAQAFRYSYHTFILWNILSTYWVTNTALIAGLFAIMVNSVFMSMVFVAAFQSRKIMPKLQYAPIIVYWLSFEYLHLNWELTWPWLTLGNGFAQWPFAVQWYEYTGVFGGSLWVWITNVLVFKGWLAFQEKRQWSRKWLLQTGALIALPIALSLVLYFTYKENGPNANIVIVQPNYEPHYEKFDIPESIQVERFLQLTQQQVDSLTDYIVYPETSFGLVEVDNMNDYRTFNRLRDFLALYPNTRLITGIDAYHIFEPGEPHTPFVRERRNSSGQSMFYEIFNGAVELSGNPQDNIAVYKKSRLVPGPEIFPFRKVLFFLKPIVEKLEGTTAGLATQPERSVFSSGKTQIGPAICYESVFGEYFTGYIRKGAKAVFIMTNDGWWDNTAGHRQHLWYASLRAIETRRAIARSANTGISAFINQRGDISQATAYGVQAAIKGNILLNDKITFYVVWGDMIARIAFFMTLLFLINTVVRVRRGKP